MGSSNEEKKIEKDLTLSLLYNSMLEDYVKYPVYFRTRPL